MSDCGKFLESVYKKCEEEAGNSESENISDKMMADLRNQKKSGKICEGLGQAGGFANKTGDLDGVENEVAIVFNENGPHYIICIMSQGINKELRRVSFRVCLQKSIIIFTQMDPGRRQILRTQTKQILKMNKAGNSLWLKGTTSES